MVTTKANDIQTVYALGMEQQAAKDFPAALKTYGRVLRMNPDIAEAHYQIGRILCDTDAANAAIPHLRKAAELRPKEDAVWKALAIAVALGGNKTIESEFLSALKRAAIPPHVKIELQDRFGAQRTASKPATGGVSVQNIRRMLQLMDSGRFSDAQIAAERFTKSNPQSAVAYNVLAATQALQGRVAAAEQNFRAAIRLDSRYAEAHEHLGRLLASQNKPEEALDAFRKAVTLAPGRTSALVALATMQTQNGSASGALPLLERAIETDPDSAEVYRALGNALTRLRKYDQAEIAFEKAIELLPKDSPDLIALLAQAQSRIGKDDSAMQNYERALAMNENTPIAVGGKALLLQTLGDFDAAETWFRKSFEIDPNNGENYRAFIASHKTKPGDPVIDRMLERYEDTSITKTDRANLGFAIAKALEDVKDYSRVFHYLDEANALIREANPYDIAKRKRNVSALLEAYADVDWHSINIEGTTDFAPIFVTGMPRSGTTLIEQIVSSHSTVTGAGEVGEAAGSGYQLVMRRGKARQFDTIAQEEFAAVGHGFKAYIRSRFPDSDKITDKSIQSYMSLGILKLAMPNARFIIVRRDPRDNLLSMYKNKFPDDTHLYSYDQHDLATYYGTFVEMIDFWRERVPDWFHEVQYEELVANPEEETRKLIAACGLEWEDACLNFHENKRKIETLSVYQARQPISKASVALWQRYEKDLKPMLDALKEGGHVPG